MKGVILVCLEDLIKEKYSEELWEDILVEAALGRSHIFSVSEDYDDEIIGSLVRSVCKTLKLSLEQAADTFGQYWVNTYAPKIYKDVYHEAESAQEYLLKMDNVHRVATMLLPNAAPPKFTFEQEAPNTIVMTYHSSRNLMDIFVGLIRGVGHYYQEDLQIEKLGDNRVKITFPETKSKSNKKEN